MRNMMMLAGIVLSSIIAVSTSTIAFLLIKQQDDKPATLENVYEEPAPLTDTLVTFHKYTPVTFNQEYRGWRVEAWAFDDGPQLLVRNPKTNEMRIVEVPEIILRNFNEGDLIK